MNSEQQRLHAHNLQNIKLADVPLWVGEEPIESHFCPRSYGWLMSTKGGRVSFLQRHPPRDACYPCSRGQPPPIQYRQYWVDSVGFKEKRKQDIGRGKQWRGIGRIGGERKGADLIKTQLMHVWNPQLMKKYKKNKKKLFPHPTTPCTRRPLSASPHPHLFQALVWDFTLHPTSHLNRKSSDIFCWRRHQKQQRLPAGIRDVVMCIEITDAQWSISLLGSCAWEEWFNYRSFAPVEH